MRVRHIIGTFVAIVVALTCVRLGFWQLDRLEQKRTYNRVLEERGQAAPEEALDLLAEPSAAEYRKAVATGTYDSSHEVLLYGRSRNDEPGNHVLTPLRLEDGTVLIVDRGWVPASIASAPVAQAPPPDGEVTLTGVLLPSDVDTPDGGPLGEDRLVKMVDIARLEADNSADVQPLYLRITPDEDATAETSLPDPQPLEALDEGPHLSYAVQWFIFAAIAIIGWLILLRRDRRTATPSTPTTVALLLLILGTNACAATPVVNPLSPSTIQRVNAAALAAALAKQRPPDTGTHSTRAAMARLCQKRHDVDRDHGPLPHDAFDGLAEVRSWIEDARGLRFIRPVGIDVVTGRELDDTLRHLSRVDPAERQKQRVASAWLQTVGALPRGTDLLKANRAFLTDQVLAFYVPAKGTLTIPTDGAISAGDRYALAHELTHALDDQHFDLVALQRSGDGCHQDARAARTALIEGNAVVASNAAVLTRFSQQDLRDMQREFGSSSDADDADDPEVPSFIMNSQIWPYLAGQAFVQEITSSGRGISVDDVFRHPPTSTEQVMHPEAYPDERPTQVNVPDFGTVVGRDWNDVVAMDVGEADVALLLAEHVSVASANDAAAGWDGGTIRVWQKEGSSAVVMDILLDDPEDADEYAKVMQRSIDNAELTAAVLPPTGTLVRTIFADDPEVLATLLPHAY